ncbi:hypothetical protein JB92DRAFT_2898720 [Gautieria morchelliformis]|nr:hypothetical protein JB92DRAFT_2898720 [Gautieria morchelliformis]
MYTRLFYSIIAGRAIKSEWLSIGTLLTAGSIAAVSLSGGSKKESSPSASTGTATVTKAQGSVGSRCVIVLSSVRYGCASGRLWFNA